MEQSRESIAEQLVSKQCLNEESMRIPWLFNGTSYLKEETAQAKALWSHRVFGSSDASRKQGWLKESLEGRGL